MRLRRTRTVLAFLGVVAGLVATYAGLIAAFGKIGTMFIPAIPLGVAIAVTRMLRPQEGTLEVDERGLSIDGRLLVRKDEIRSGAARWVRGDLVAELGGPNVTAQIEASAIPEVDALLAPLGLDARHRRVHFRLRAPGPPFVRQPALLVALVAALVLSAAATAITHVPILPFAMVATLLPLGIAAALSEHRRRVDVTVGADGIEVRPARGPRRFLPIADIASVKVEGTAVVVVRADGREEVFGEAWQERSDREPEDRAREVAARVESAIAAAEGSAGDAGAEALLARRGRSTADWLGALRAATEEGGYRTARTSREALLSVVRDGQAAPGARVAAAVALAPKLRDDERAALEELSGATGSEALAQRIRVVLDRPDDARALEEALAEEEALADAKALETE